MSPFLFCLRNFFDLQPQERLSTFKLSSSHNVLIYGSSRLLACFNLLIINYKLRQQM